MTLAERIDAYKRAYAETPASWPWLTREDDRDVLYAVWVIGNDYRNKTRYYGAYPPRFLDHVMALFPDVAAGEILHVFSGSLPKHPDYVRLDLNPMLEPDVVGSVYDAPAVLGDRRFPLIIADPPYSDGDAERYGTVMIDRLRVTEALAGVAPIGGLLVWLDVCWPMHRKSSWVTVGRIYLQRATNHRVRACHLFQRVA